jgi:hypothetical protein
LEAKVYINSGVFFVPSNQSGFVQTAYQESLNDELWKRYIIPEKLYDNHFLCGCLNRWNWPMEYVDAEVFNWQGFFVPGNGDVLVERSRDHLINKINQKTLALVHFAGERDLVGFVCRLPLTIAGLLAGRTTGAVLEEDSSEFSTLRTIETIAMSSSQATISSLQLGIDKWRPILDSLSIRCIQENATLEPDQIGTICVILSNPGTDWVWGIPVVPLYLSYHWYREAGDVLVWDGLRTSILPLAPGRTNYEAMQVQAPADEGVYLLRPALVVEGHFWLNQEAPLVRIRVSSPPPHDRHLKLRTTASLAIATLRQTWQEQLPLSLPQKANVPPLVVNVTSFPDRIGEVWLALVSMFRQTLLPDVIILTLAEDEFPEREAGLPMELKVLISKGLRIRWWKNWGPYKKLIPSLLELPDAIHITIDDDNYYPKDLVSGLHKSYLANPKSVHCLRLHRIALTPEGSIGPYEQWLKAADSSELDFRNFPMGAGGVLYPPGVLDPFVVNSETFRDLGIDKGKRLVHFNVNKEENDLQLRRVLARFPELLSRINAHPQM